MARGKRQFEEKVFVPCASISPNRIAQYSRPIDGFQHSSGHTANWINLDDNDHEGKISNKSRKKIETALTWLLYIAKPKTITDVALDITFKFKINFITLTLPSTQVHSDQEIKDVCLNNFLTVCRKYGLKNYLWRAEAQPRTNNIHFHITTDKYIHYKDIQKWWNQSLSLLGYIEEFRMKHGHGNPNSTDVHSVKHVRNLTSYLCKYLGKNRSFPCVGELRLTENGTEEYYYTAEEYKKEKANKKHGKVIGHILGSRVRPIEGRLWGCSQSLSKIKPVIFDGEQYNFGVMIDFVDQCDFRRYSGEHVSLYFGDIAKESGKWFPQLAEALARASKLEKHIFSKQKPKKV